MKHTRNILIHSVLLGVMALSMIPVLASAQGLVPCGIDANNDKIIPTRAQGGQPPDVQCEFSDFMTLVQRFLNYLIYIVAAPIAAIMFAIAGYMYLTAGDEMGKIKKAHDIFVSVLWGFGIMLIAWALVSFIINFFTDGTTYNLLEAPTPPSAP